LITARNFDCGAAAFKVAKLCRQAASETRATIGVGMRDGADVRVVIV